MATAALVDLESVLVIAAALGELTGSGNCSSGGLGGCSDDSSGSRRTRGSSDCSSGGFGFCAGDGGYSS